MLGDLETTTGAKEIVFLTENVEWIHVERGIYVGKVGNDDEEYLGKDNGCMRGFADGCGNYRVY